VLTLLGNIVAVSSIITVVALITGVNAAVTRRDRVGSRRRFVHHPADGDHAERGRFERMRNNPHVRSDDAQAVKRFAHVGASIMAQAQTQTRWRIATRSCETLQVQGVSEEYLDFATFDAERGG
jgi:hypothetical protein